jgi:hypothetical protein
LYFIHKHRCNFWKPRLNSYDYITVEDGEDLSLASTDGLYEHQKKYLSRRSLILLLMVLTISLLFNVHSVNQGLHRHSHLVPTKYGMINLSYGYYIYTYHCFSISCQKHANSLCSLLELRGRGSSYRRRGLEITRSRPSNWCCSFTQRDFRINGSSSCTEMAVGSFEGYLLTKRLPQSTLLGKSSPCELHST